MKLAPFSDGEEFAQAAGMKLIQRSRMVRVEPVRDSSGVTA